MVSPVTFLLRTVLAVCVLPALSVASDCFPRADDNKPQYLVAYGSFLYEEARKNSSLQMMRDAPVWVEGYKRGWITRSTPETTKMTRLGIVSSPGDRFNGVVVSLKSGQITSLDSDDKAVCRINIATKNLVPITSSKVKDDGEYWIYVTRKKLKQEPVANYPIYQSQVDAFLTGCLEQAERFKLPDFADQCLKTTYGWNSNWVNDRMRPVLSKLVQGRKAQVDELLMKYQKEYFAPIRVE